MKQNRHQISCCRVIKCAAFLGFMAVLLPSTIHAEVAIPDRYKTGGFAIGCQAFSYNRWTVMEAIERTAEAGGRVIEFYPGQKLSKDRLDIKFSHDCSDDVVAEVKAKLLQQDIFAVNYGVVGIPGDEAKARKIFEFARKMGMYGITTESLSSMDVIEKLVKEFDVRVCFHNHPKRGNDPDYKLWDPQHVLPMIKSRDHRIGICADVGHWCRSGLDPVDCLKAMEGRIVSVHLRDRERIGADSVDVPVGSGVLNIKAIFDELKRQRFAGNISIEYANLCDVSALDTIKKSIRYVHALKK